MRAWLGFVARNRLLEIALSLAIGFAALDVAQAISQQAIGALAQHMGRNPYGEAADTAYLDAFASPTYLNFSVGDTVIVYGQTLVALVALGLIALIGRWVIGRRDRELGECPFCASRIPYESTHCAFCGSGVTPSEP